MTQRSFIFGGNTGLTYADLVRSRDRANKLLQDNGTPQTMWGGIGAIGEAFIGKSQRDKANKALGERNSAFRNALMGHAYADASGAPAPGGLEGLLSLASDANYSPEQQKIAMELYRDRVGFERGADERALNMRILQAQAEDAERGPARKTTQGADGYQYYIDDGSRVLPNVTAPAADRDTIQGADGYQYYTDDGSRVLPDVTAAKADNRTTDQKNFEAAQAGGFEGSFNEWLLQKRKAGATNVSVNTGVDRPKPPAGYDYERGADGDVIVDENNAASLVAIPGGPQAAEITEQGVLDQEGILSMDATLDVIDQALNHPGLDSSVGTVQGRLPPVTNAQADFNAILAQIQGGVFLRAFETLKGGGQITEIESQKAEAAMARLTRVQSEEGFRKSLKELQDIVAGARARAVGRSSNDTPSDSTGLSAAEILAKYGITE